MNDKLGTIPKTTGSLMLAIAGAIDAVQFFVGLLDILTFIVGTIINILIGSFMALTFFMWFAAKGVINKKTTLVLIGCVTGRSVPFFSSLPTWTGAILYLLSAQMIANISQIVPGGAVVANSIMKISGQGGLPSTPPPIPRTPPPIRRTPPPIPTQTLRNSPPLTQIPPSPQPESRV